MENMNQKRAYNTIEAAEYIGVKERTLRISRTPSSKVKFEGPPFKRIGPRKVVYLKEDLDRWLDNLETGL